MQLEAKGKHVLLEIVTRVDQFANDTKARSGLLIDREKIRQDEPYIGIVYAIGSAVRADVEYQVGDRVIFHTKEVFQGFEYAGKKFCSMLHEEIMAVITEGNS